YGGVLFVPLNMNLIKRWGNDWSRSAPIALLEARNEWASLDRQELVVALQVMAADVNLGYHDWRNWVVHTVNGEPIRDFNQFVAMLRENSEPFVVFRNENGYQMVIDHEEALASEEQILARYRIPSAYSNGLLDEQSFSRQP
ncbi:MAG: protease, partial [Gammaproteobacteria bacterium]|nr:protease [Gammaproteobacteria bacterium]